MKKKKKKRQQETSVGTASVSEAAEGTAEVQEETEVQEESDEGTEAVETAASDTGEATDETISEDPAAEAEEAPSAQSEAEAPVAMDANQAAEQFEVEAKADAAETEDARLRAMLEAIVYVLEEPLPAAQIAQALGQPKEKIEKALAELVADLASPGRGLMIREVAGGFKMSTKPEFHEEIRTFVKKLKPPLKLSQAALETLAVIAYKQPITAPEILEIRGVQGGGVLKTLLERKLVTAAGRKQVVGRPVLYKTTKEFLVQFGLRDLNELPTLKEFEEWSRLAIEEANAQANEDAKIQRSAGEGPAPESDSAPEPVEEPAAAAEPAEPVSGEDSNSQEPAQEQAPESETAERPSAEVAREQPEPEEPTPAEEATHPMPDEPQASNEDSPDKPPPEILDGAASAEDGADKPPPEILDGEASAGEPPPGTGGN